MSDYICPHNCAYRTSAGRCGMEGGYESCQYIKYLEKLEKEKTNIKPYAGKRTNYDLLISKTPEELAEYIRVFFPEVCHPGKCPGEDYCYKCWLDWLKNPADKEGEG